MMQTRVATPALLAALLTLSGCFLLTVEENQKLRLVFELDQTVPADESSEAYSVIAPRSIDFKKSFVKVYGQLVPPEGELLPDKVKLTVTSTDMTTEEVFYTYKLTLTLDEEGSFSDQKKYKKPPRENTLLSFFAEPVGSTLEPGTRVTLCAEMAKKKKDLSDDAYCLPDTGGGGGGGTNRVVVADNLFDPMVITIDPGASVTWELDSNASLNHTVTAGDGSFDSGFLNFAGAIFERNFTEDLSGQIIEYVCVTHEACCNMVGAVRVGEDAPDPGY